MTETILKLRQAGEPVLRLPTQPLSLANCALRQVLYELFEASVGSKRNAESCSDPNAGIWNKC